MADKDLKNLCQMYCLMNSFQKSNSSSVVPSPQNKNATEKKIKDTPIVFHSQNVVQQGFVAKAFTRGTAEDDPNTGNTWVNLVDGSLSSILARKRASAIDSAAADAQERLANAGANMDYYT